MRQIQFSLARTVVLVFVLSVGNCNSAWSQQAPVVVTKVVEKAQSTSETFIGTAEPKRRSIVGCAVDGRMLQFFVDEGKVIKMLPREEGADPKLPRVGQPIAQLRTKTIEIQVAAARAQLMLRDNELKQLEKSLPQQLVQAKARLASAEATAKQAAAEFKRIQSLFKRDKVVSQSDFDTAQSESVAAQQNRLGAQSMVDELEATSDLKLAQSKAELLFQQKEVERMEDLKSKYTIRTPFRGHIVHKHVEVGQWIKQGDPIAEVIRLHPIEIEIPVPAKHIERIQGELAELNGSGKKLEVAIQFDALPGHLFEGQVSRIVPDADQRARAIPVKVKVDNPHEEGHPIKPGMLARVVLPVGRKERQTHVPKDALVLGGESPIVYVVATDPKDKKKKTVRPVSVELGASIGSWIAVQGQLKAGDQVVIEGNERLRPGQAILITEVIPPESQ